MKATVPTFSRVGDTTTHTLADFTPDKGTSTKSFTASNFSLYFYKSNGAQMPVLEDTWITNTYPSILTDTTVQWSKAKVVIWWNATKQHWYLFNQKFSTKTSYTEYPMDDYPIKAGEGFLIKVGKDFADGVTLNLPNALN